MDIISLRNEFPILNTKVNNKTLVYLDNGATSQKPQSVIDCLNEYYSTYNANIHRGVHYLSQFATSAYEEAREKISNYINSPSAKQVIFTKGTTDGINLVANGFSRGILKEGDEVLISGMEHHSNIVPWQLACEYTGAKLKVIPVLDNGELDEIALGSLLTDKVKILALTHVSNTLGTVNPVKRIIELAHQKNIPVLIDGAQSVQHIKVDVQELNADFYVFSGHKMFGPTGTGILYGKEEWLLKLPPYQGGGDMIKTVTFEKTTYNDLPHKFEAGTPHIAGGIALGKAVDFLKSLNFEWLHQHENTLLQYTQEELKKIEGIRIVGEAKNKSSVISFVHNQAHHYDIGTILDQMGIAIRTGHHCTEPLMHRMGVSGTARASFAVYNTLEEADIFVTSLKKSLKMLL